MTEVWFSYSGFRFSREQVLWALKHLQILRQGIWPPDFKESGYTGNKGKQSKKAPFENPAVIASEIDHRLVSTGLDGILLEYVYSQDTQDRLSLEYHLAQAMRLDLNTIDRRIEQALRYCCGYRRKTRTYKQWRQHRGSSS